MSMLHPTPIVDKNGKSTTVHKKSPTSASGSKRAAAITPPSIILGTASENLQSLDDFISSYVSEFKKRGYVENENNRRAQTVREIASDIEKKLNDISRKNSEPEMVVEAMYGVLNESFSDNAYVPSVDSEDEIYRKTVNREFILDTTLLLGGKNAAMYPDAADL